MASPESKGKKKKYFTAAHANATLPLIRAIVRDVVELTRSLQERHDLLSERHVIDEAHREELQELRASFERDKDRMKEYCQELEELGIELKDARAGLIDFPCWIDNREVYLCWRLGEPEVAYWHELDAGFAGRQRLTGNSAGSGLSVASTPGPRKS
jgi:hypothetical protein